jgi:hypothetical protein
MGCTSSTQKVAQPGPVLKQQIVSEEMGPLSEVLQSPACAGEEDVSAEGTGDIGDIGPPNLVMAAGTAGSAMGAAVAEDETDSRIVAFVESTEEEEEIGTSHNNAIVEELKNDDVDEVHVETVEETPSLTVPATLLTLLTIDTTQAIVERDIDSATSSSSEAAPCSTALQFLDLDEVKELTLTHLKIRCAVHDDFFLHTASSLRALPLELFHLGDSETNAGIIFKGAFPPQTLELNQQTLITLEIYNVRSFDLLALGVAFSAAQRSLRCVKITSCDSMRVQSIQEEHQLLLSETFSQVPTCVEELSLLYSIELSDQVLDLLSPPLKSLSSLRRFTASRLVPNSQPLRHAVPPCSLACSGSGQTTNEHELHEAVSEKPFQVPRLTQAAWVAFKNAYPVARARIDALSIEALGDKSSNTTTGTNPFAADALLPALDKGIFGEESENDGVGRCVCIA